MPIRTQPIPTHLSQPRGPRSGLGTAVAWCLRLTRQLLGRTAIESDPEVTLPSGLPACARRSQRL